MRSELVIDPNDVMLMGAWGWWEERGFTRDEWEEALEELVVTALCHWLRSFGLQREDRIGLRPGCMLWMRGLNWAEVTAVDNDRGRVRLKGHGWWKIDDVI